MFLFICPFSSALIHPPIFSHIILDYYPASRYSVFPGAVTFSITTETPTRDSWAGKLSASLLQSIVSHRRQLQVRKESSNWVQKPNPCVETSPTTSSGDPYLQQSTCFSCRYWVNSRTGSCPFRLNPATPESRPLAPADSMSSIHQHGSIRGQHHNPCFKNNQCVWNHSVWCFSSDLFPLAFSSQPHTVASRVTQTNPPWYGWSSRRTDKWPSFSFWVSARVLYVILFIFIDTPFCILHSVVLMKLVFEQEVVFTLYRSPVHHRVTCTSLPDCMCLDYGFIVSTNLPNHEKWCLENNVIAKLKETHFTDTVHSFSVYFTSFITFVLLEASWWLKRCTGCINYCTIVLTHPSLQWFAGYCFSHAHLSQLVVKAPSPRLAVSCDITWSSLSKSTLTLAWNFVIVFLFRLVLVKK